MRSRKRAWRTLRGPRRKTCSQDRAQTKALWSTLWLRKPRQNTMRHTGLGKGLSVSLQSLGSPSPRLPGPAGPGWLQTQLGVPRSLWASHPGLPGTGPLSSPASAPRRPQLRDASEASGFARLHPVSPPDLLRSLPASPHPPTPSPHRLFRARPVNNTRTCRRRLLP